MNLTKEMTMNDDDKPDLKWNAFGYRFGLAIVAMGVGTVASELLGRPGLLAVSIALALLGAAIMVAMIWPRKDADEFDTAISMKAGTTAGVSTVLFIVTFQLYGQVAGVTPFAALALPGFYLTQWLIMSQFLRWQFSKGDA